MKSLIMSLFYGMGKTNMGDIVIAKTIVIQNKYGMMRQATFRVLISTEIYNQEARVGNEIMKIINVVRSINVNLDKMGNKQCRIHYQENASQNNTKITNSVRPNKVQFNCYFFKWARTKSYKKKIYFFSYVRKLFDSIFYHKNTQKTTFQIQGLKNVMYMLIYRIKAIHLLKKGVKYIIRHRLVAFFLNLHYNQSYRFKIYFCIVDNRERLLERIRLFYYMLQNKYVKQKNSIASNVHYAYIVLFVNCYIMKSRTILR